MKCSLSLIGVFAFLLFSFTSGAEAHTFNTINNNNYKYGNTLGDTCEQQYEQDFLEVIRNTSQKANFKIIQDNNNKTTLALSKTVYGVSSSTFVGYDCIVSSETPLLSRLQSIPCAPPAPTRDEKTIDFVESPRKNIYRYLTSPKVTETVDQETPIEWQIIPQAKNRENLNALLNQWCNKKAAINGTQDIKNGKAYPDSVEIPDTVFINRIQGIKADVKLVYNSEVKKEIKRYTNPRYRSYIERLIGKAEYYFPVFEEILDAHNLPFELKYLPVIESAINPNAVSYAGAAGMWQFMPGTGKLYDLNVNRYVDERRNPEKATHAAARYLAYLHSFYNDWTLALAAYNCGPGTINSAIKRSGETTYWGIYDYLPKETRGYVPRYIAASYLMNYYKLHHMEPIPYNMPAVADTVMIGNENLKLMQVAGVLNIPIEKLTEMNPQYKRGVIPAQNKAYPLKLPFEYSSQFIALEDSIYTYDQKKAQKAQFLAEVSTKDKTKLYYTVKTGDNLGLIANLYDIQVQTLKTWNNISHNKIAVGDKLLIYIPENKVQKYQTVNTMTIAQKRKKRSTSASLSSNYQPKVLHSFNGNGDYVYYKIRSGDNLWDIARRFPGVSAENLMRLNNISPAAQRRIKVGQVIKIKRK